MSSNDIVLAPQTLLFQPGVQGIEALEPGSRDEKVPPPIADHPFDITFVVPLA
jgi:hypothetical protein